jgi:hypothetical protein
VKDPLLMTVSERKSDLAVMQKFAQIVLYAILSLDGLLLAFGVISTMMTH